MVCKKCRKIIPRGKKKERCNFYFGGFDGGNRCQKELGHPEDEGHEWKAVGRIVSTRMPKLPGAAAAQPGDKAGGGGRAMNREARFLMYGVVGIGMGFAIFYTSHNWWGLRGLLYAVVGGIMVYLYAAKRNSQP